MSSAARRVGGRATIRSRSSNRSASPSRMWRPPPSYIERRKNRTWGRNSKYEESKGKIGFRFARNYFVDNANRVGAGQSTVPESAIRNPQSAIGRPGRRQSVEARHVDAARRDDDGARKQSRHRGRAPERADERIRSARGPRVL